MPDPLDLNGRVAIVTGGGTGIGEATAKVLSSRGAHLTIAARKVENLERVTAEITAVGGRCIAVPTDVRDEAAIDVMVGRTVEEYGRVDILVNNAGGAYMFPLVDTPPERWDASVSLNLRGPYLASRAVGRHMIAQRGGAIVNISSAAGLTGVRGGAAYGAGKAGLQMFTRIAAAEWGPYGIRVNCIAVGLVASAGALRSWERAGIDVPEAERDIPLRRVGQPDDIANAVLYLVSDLSSWVTGQTLPVDGGPQLSGYDPDGEWR